MDFLSTIYSLFNGDATLNNRKQNQLNTMMQVNQVSKPQSSLSQNNSFQTCLQKNQFKNSSIRIVDTNFPAFFQLIKTQRVILPHFGDLVGIVGKQVSFLRIPNENTIIRVGKTSQINSVGAIRKNALDSLLVCFDQNDCEFDLQQIFLAQQRLILLVESEVVLNRILKKLESIIPQLFIDQPLSQSCSYLCIEIAKYQNRYFVQFKDGSYFCDYFENQLRKINIQVSNRQQQLALIKKITLKDYVDFRFGKPSVKAKFLNVQKEIKLQLQKSRKKQQDLRMIKFYENVSENDCQEFNAKPKRKSSSFEAEIQAEYFKIRASQKKTGETEIQEHIDTTDLFYLIQQRDSSCNSDKSEEKRLRVIPKKKPKQDKSRQRSKSEHCIEIIRSQILDDQFFTRQ